jgi:DNA-binding NtrC family response regulator
MCKILVVDDEEDVRVALKRRLEREGHRVTTAGSEAEALELINAADPPFDIVLTDMLMESQHSGLNILKAVVSRDIFTEVIVLTAYGNVANAVECMKHGAFDYVEKNLPGVDVYELIVMKIDQAMEQRRATKQTVRKLEELRRRVEQSKAKKEDSNP